MQSNIYQILLFSLVALVAFYASPKRFRPSVILVESVLFYALCDYKFLALVLAETAGTWLIGKKIVSERSKHKKWLICGIVFVLLVLAVFKYFDFFVNRFGISLAHLILPLGISYYSFKCISYIADIYLGKRRAEESFVHYASYVMFFPHLICGPIVRSDTMTVRMKEGLVFDEKKTLQGIMLIISGLFKKLVIADSGGGTLV